MGSHLCCARTLSTDLMQVFFDLHTARTRCLQILLRITLNLRLPVPAAFDLIAQALQPHCKLGPVHSCRILLRLEETALLQCARLPIVPLGHIENDRVSMKLRSSIAIHWTSGVMLEGSGDELARCLRRMDIADPCLCIPLQLLQRDANTFTVRLTNTIIATHKGCKRNRLGCGERSIPPCSMF